MNDKDMYNRCIIPEIIRESRGQIVCTKGGQNKQQNLQHTKISDVDIVKTRLKLLKYNFYNTYKITQGTYSVHTKPELYR